MKTTDFEILRNIKSDSKIGIPLDAKPVRVATILDQEKFNITGYEIIHNETVFIEERVHDWHWHNGMFYYYSRVCETADVLISYSPYEK